jgi:hypothetical protein
MANQRHAVADLSYLTEQTKHHDHSLLKYSITFTLFPKLSPFFSIIQGKTLIRVGYMCNVDMTNHPLLRRGGLSFP